ncbi:hypothetical protein F0562_017991 [Nyssa sinensis]|uniref:Uncharacterized protein n=1 Tax=Nyssa sinensis TaxID=561372 RepID=A0A5J4ZAQ4_9ASTE|nr:hypothetical protein F0562_017991 [Nyssa sinensis]
MISKPLVISVKVFRLSSTEDLREAKADPLFSILELRLIQDEQRFRLLASSYPAPIVLSPHFSRFMEELNKEGADVVEELDKEEAAAEELLRLWEQDLGSHGSVLDRFPQLLNSPSELRSPGSSFDRLKRFFNSPFYKRGDLRSWVRQLCNQHCVTIVPNDPANPTIDPTVPSLGFNDDTIAPSNPVTDGSGNMHSLFTRHNLGNGGNHAIVSGSDPATDLYNVIANPEIGPLPSDPSLSNPGNMDFLLPVDSLLNPPQYHWIPAIDGLGNIGNVTETPLNFTTGGVAPAVGSPAADNGNSGETSDKRIRRRMKDKLSRERKKASNWGRRLGYRGIMRRGLRERDKGGGWIGPGNNEALSSKKGVEARGLEKGGVAVQLAAESVVAQLEKEGVEAQEVVERPSLGRGKGMCGEKVLDKKGIYEE